LREEYRMRVSKNRVVREIFGARRDEITGSAEDHVTKSFEICASYQMSLG
jgi:hypothetical protein